MSSPVTTSDAPTVPAREDRAASEKPLLLVTAGRGRLSLQTFRELWEFREVLAAFAVRFVKIKYKQAAVGVGWAILQPILSALVFALVFGRYAKLPSEGIPYLLFALTGMVAWSYFSTAVTTASQSLVEDQALIRKVYFPRETTPLGAVLAGLIDLASGLVVLFVVLLLYGKWPALSWILVPVPLLVLVLTASAVSLGFSCLNVYYRDVRYVLPFLLQLGLFASAVVYPVSVFPAGFRSVWSVANPVVAVIESLRAMLARGHWPDLPILFGALGWALLLVFLNYSLFKRLERSFADRV